MICREEAHFRCGGAVVRCHDVGIVASLVHKNGEGLIFFVENEAILPGIGIQNVLVQLIGPLGIIQRYIEERPAVICPFRVSMIINIAVGIRYGFRIERSCREILDVKLADL